jgi:hypothetical protein
MGSGEALMGEGPRGHAAAALGSIDRETFSRIGDHPNHLLETRAMHQQSPRGRRAGQAPAMDQMIPWREQRGRLAFVPFRVLQGPEAPGENGMHQPEETRRDPRLGRCVGDHGAQNPHPGAQRRPFDQVGDPFPADSRRCLPPPPRR